MEVQLLFIELGLEWTQLLVDKYQPQSHSGEQMGAGENIPQQKPHSMGRETRILVYSCLYHMLG
jgi:hypothetical protein